MHKMDIQIEARDQKQLHSIEDLARLAKTSDEFFSDDMFNFIQKKFTTTREDRPEAYNLVNTYCSDVNMEIRVKIMQQQ